MKCLDRTMKKITDTLVEACHVPIRDVCVLNHNDESFKAYVHGTTWICQRVYDTISNVWGVSMENISITESPESWWPLGSRGYVIEVNYE